MKKIEYLNLPIIVDFVEWLASSSETIRCDLRVRHSPKVPGGIQADCVGLQDILRHYTWKASWNNENQAFKSSDWQSTQRSLHAMSALLKASVASDDQQRVLRACLSILDWGGDRNPRNGAGPKLKALANQSDLVRYLKFSKQVFDLDSCDLDQLDALEYAGSMWTKIYALHSSDGLPIYDSRVGAAIAALVEVFRCQSRQSWKQVPEVLRFGIERYKNRSVERLNPEGIRPAYFRRTSKNFAKEWSSATVRLAWLMQAVLEIQPSLYASEGTHLNRMHAFEATLFMIGYDLQSLRVSMSVQN